MKIEEYDCYRQLLSDLFYQAQQKNKKFSYQYVANRLNVSKPYLKHVIEGQRHISIDKVTEICKLFHLTQWQSHYFLILFLMNTTKDENLVSYFQLVLQRISGKNLFHDIQTSDENDPDHEVFHSWLSMVLHSMSKLNGFKPDPKWVKARLCDQNVSEESIAWELKRLIDKKSIVQEGGRWKPAKFIHTHMDDYLMSDVEVYSMGLSRIQDAIQEQGSYAPYHFHVMTLGIKQEDVKKAISLYADFMENLMALSKNTKESDVVMFASNNLITMSKPQGEK